ncbi:MAG TPA: TRAP transporter substrate-binding protein [Candidatus Sulfotelmatobacter sp.]|nr:TRAP transporter substrate-binding protein [Candidatus Sulfotelmatobacter sp.]
MAQRTTHGWLLVLITGLLGLVLAAATGSAAEPKVAKLGLIAPMGHPVQVASERLAKLVAERTGNRLQIQVFPGGTLGGEIDLRDGVGLGTVQMAGIGYPIMNGIVKEMEILNLYYLWRDRAHMMKVVDGPIGADFNRQLRARNIEVLAANWQQGTRQTLTKRPARNPREFNGIKIRVTAGIPVYQDLWQAMGAISVPLPFPELYSALQQGVVDSVELPLDWMWNGKFYKLGKNIDLTSHFVYTNCVLINTGFFASLPADVQKILRDTAVEVGAWQTEQVLGQEKDLRQKMEAEGIGFVDTDVEAFRAAVQPVYKKWESKWGKELYDRIVNTR